MPKEKKKPEPKKKPAKKAAAPAKKAAPAPPPPKPAESNVVKSGVIRRKEPTPPPAPEPTNGVCVIVNCSDVRIPAIKEDNEVLKKLWTNFGYKTYAQTQVSAKAVRENIVPTLTKHMQGDGPKHIVLALIAEEQNGERCDREGEVVDLLETFNFLSTQPGLDKIPKLFFMHVYHIDRENGKKVQQQNIVLPAVRNLLLYHYIDKEAAANQKGNKIDSMAKVLSTVLTSQKEQFDVVKTLNKVTSLLPRPSQSNYRWIGPVCTCTLFKPLYLEQPKN